MERKPLFFFMNSPADSNSRLLKLFWKGLNKIIGKFNFLGYLLGPVVFLVDYFLTRIFKEGPSTEIAVCRHKNNYSSHPLKNHIKVLVISHMYLSTFDKISLFTHQQVKELAQQGCGIKVIVPLPWIPFPLIYFSKKWREYSKVPSKMILDGIEVYYPRYLEFPRGIFFASSGKRMYKGIKGLSGKIYKDFQFDLIHAHVALPDGYAGMLLAERYKKPLIITIHGQDFQQTIYRNKKCRENVKKVISFSKKTIVVSNKLARISRKELGIAPDKIIIVPNGVDLNNIHYHRDILFERYKDKKIILSISTLRKIKGIDLNLFAIKKLKEKHKNLIYLIIGDGEERDSLESLVKKLNIEDSVQFLGLLPHKEAMEYLSICDVFSLPSWDEGFGVTYLEAAVYGKPVVACQGQGIDGVLENNKTGFLVKPRDINDLMKTLDFLLSNQAQARKVGEKAKKIVLENYTWKHIIPKLIKIYEEALNN